MKRETETGTISHAKYLVDGAGRALAEFWRDERGQDLIEYSLLLVFVSLVVIGLIGSIGTSLTTFWTKINSNLSSAAHAAS